MTNLIEKYRIWRLGRKIAKAAAGDPLGPAYMRKQEEMNRLNAEALRSDGWAGSAWPLGREYRATDPTERDVFLEE